MACLTEAIEIATESDSDYETAQVFQNSLQIAMKPYQELLRQQSEKTKNKRII